jgi:hypothetical protein
MNDERIEEYVAMRAYETREMNLERRRIFFLILGRTANIDEAITYANVNVNMKYLKCKYRPEITDRLQKYMQEA